MGNVLSPSVIPLGKKGWLEDVYSGHTHVCKQKGATLSLEVTSSSVGIF
jgi:hypothetical protein